MYKIHLILKYLLKRRIAWVSLAAVMLCTTMVLVVISVMGGWLNMFKHSFRGLSGDIVIHSDTLKGFPYYQEMIDAIAKDPTCKVEAAVPSIETAALFDYGNGPKPVRVMGIPIADMAKVNKFNESLFRQKGPAIPSFDLQDVVTAPLAALPAELKFAKPADADDILPPGLIALPDSFDQVLKDSKSLRYDGIRHNLVYRAQDGPMPDVWKHKFAELSPNPAYQEALAKLSAASRSDSLIHYAKPQGYNGLIVGTGVIGVHRDQEGNWIRALPTEWQVPTHLTVLDLSGGHFEAQDAHIANFYIVDDSHLGVWQYDSNYVYVDFDLLQRYLGMDPKPGTDERTGKPVTVPARVTDIHLKMKPGIDANNEDELRNARDHIEAVVNNVVAKHVQDGSLSPFEARPPDVETWQETQRIWISAVENEKLLTVFLFGIMCIVAIFLIFCIFYMIVVEKTRDIGIIKSVGATSSGVAGIFLGYGLVIGVLGAGLGLMLSYFLVHYINQLHALLGRLLHIQIWNPQVYLFDKIPNEMRYQDIMWILPIAVLASVLGALIPAIRAARMDPIEALRWE